MNRRRSRWYNFHLGWCPRSKVPIAGRLPWRSYVLMDRQVVISDYPAKALLANVRRNVDKAFPPDDDAVSSLRSRCQIEGYEWGDTTSPFASAQAHSFSRILAADCFWMPHEHENLVKSMLHMLSTSPSARIFCIAGFHTGRAKVTVPTCVKSQHDAYQK